MIETLPIAPTIDHVLSREGGFVRGKLVEIFGPDGAGKTSFAMLVIIAAQRQGLKVGYVDNEDLNKDHAAWMGVALESLDYREPDTAEEALTNIIEMCEKGYGLVILDSVAGMLTEAQMECTDVGEAGKYGQIAGLLARELGKVKKVARKGNTIVILLNEIRAKFNTGFGFGPKTESFGGYTLKNRVVARFELRRVSWIKKSMKVIGSKLKIRAPHKNRYASPNQDGYIDIIFEQDVDVSKLNKNRKNKLNIVQGDK